MNHIIYAKLKEIKAHVFKFYGDGLGFGGQAFVSQEPFIPLFCYGNGELKSRSFLLIQDEDLSEHLSLHIDALY